MLALGMCKISTTTYDQTVTRGADATTTDSFSPDVPIAVDNTGAPVIDSITQGGTTYTGFTASIDGNGNVVIDWTNAPSRPAEGTQYVVTYFTTSTAMVAFDAEAGPRRVDSAGLLDMVRSWSVGVWLEANPQPG
jgi:hypothetical protein